MQNSAFTVAFPRLFVQFLDRLPACFQRRRGRLGPAAVFLTLVTMSVLEKRSYARALEQIRLGLGARLGWEHDEPTRSAFCQARKKLLGSECVDAFYAIRSVATRARELPHATFHGYRIYALDGTKLNLPISPALVKKFGCPSNRKATECPQAGLVLLWDVGANQPVAWELGPCNLSERGAGARLFEHLGPDVVMLGDRGLPGLEFFYLARQRKAHYVIRMNTTSVAKTKEFCDFITSSDQERIVTFDPVVNKYRRFPGDAPLTVRFVRDPKKPDSVLATSFLDAAVTAAEFWQLYGKRWEIETAIREGKQWHGLEDFHARYVDGIHQEVAAIMTYLHLTSELEVEMRHKVIERVAKGEEPPESANHIPYRFNRLLMADMVVGLIMTALTKPEILADEWAHCIRSLWRNRDRIRPGRSYPRTCKSPRGLTRRAKFSRNGRNNAGN